MESSIYEDDDDDVNLLIINKKVDQIKFCHIKYQGFGNAYF